MAQHRVAIEATNGPEHPRVQDIRPYCAGGRRHHNRTNARRLARRPRSSLPRATHRRRRRGRAGRPAGAWPPQCPCGPPAGRRGRASSTSCDLRSFARPRHPPRRPRGPHDLELAVAAGNAVAPVTGGSSPAPGTGRRHAGARRPHRGPGRPRRWPGRRRLGPRAQRLSPMSPPITAAVDPAVVDITSQLGLAS